MKRKIIRQGHNTLTMTLPAEWSKKLNLQAGDEVDLVEDSGSLIINGKQNNGFKSITIDITGLSIPMLWRFFQGAYREGYDEIKLKYENGDKRYPSIFDYYASKFEYSKMGEKQRDKSALEMITDLVNRFIGIEIIDHGEDYVVIREMGDISSKEFDSSLRRIFLLILDLFEKSVELIEKNKIGDVSIGKTLHTMDTNVDRFIDYCCRINNKIKDSSFQKNKPIMFSTLYLLELLGDEFKYVGRHLINAKKNVTDLLPFAELVKEHFESYYHFFYKFSKKAVIEFGELDSKVFKEHFKFKSVKNSDIQDIQRHFMLISKFTFSLAELRIEGELGKGENIE
jgi:phosphate uptake regulator